MSRPALEAVNTVLATFAEGWSFRPGYNATLWLHDPQGGGQAVRLRSDRLWLVRVNRRLSLGGTTEQAIAQLVLWLRDLPRRPLEWWEHACSPQVGLGSPSTLLGLHANGYDDPARTACVLCGQHERPRADWWALGRVIGPCCLMGRCRKEPVRA